MTMLRRAVTRSTTLSSSTRRYGYSILIVPQVSKTFSVLNKPPPNYPGYVPLNRLERGVLGIGSGIGSLWDPRQADLVGAFAEETAGPFLERLRDTMLSGPTGRRILRDRPRINSNTMPIENLREFPENTFGRCLADYLDDNGMSLDERDDVKYIDDEECAYVMQRYREGHDCWHALTGLPATYKEGEVALKAFESFNTGLPMAFLSLFYVIKLNPEERNRFWNTYLPWGIKNGLISKSIVTVYWEEELATDVDVLRGRLRVEKPPNLRELRKADRRRPAKGAL